MLSDLFKKISPGEVQFGKYFDMKVLCERFEPILAHQLGIVESEVEEEGEAE